MTVSVRFTCVYVRVCACVCVCVRARVKEGKSEGEEGLTREVAGKRIVDGDGRIEVARGLFAAPLRGKHGVGLGLLVLVLGLGLGGLCTRFFRRTLEVNTE